MASERSKIDANFKVGGVVAGVTDDASLDITMLRVDPTTKRLKVIATIDTFTGVVDNEVVEATDTGTLILGTDGSNYQILAVDASGQLQVDVLSGGGGYQYAEDTAHSTGDFGNLALAVENEDQADLSTGDKDYTPLAVTKEGNLIIKSEGTITVDCNGSDVTVDNAAASGVYVRPGTAATFPTSIAASQVASGAFLSGALADGAIVTLGAKTDARSTATDATSITIMQVLKEVSYMEQNPAARVVDLGTNNDVTIDNSSIVHLEDATHSTGDAGVMSLGVRNDANAVLGAHDLDYTPLQVTSSGRIKAEVHGVGTAAGDLGKTEDATHSTGDAGVMALAVENEDQADLSTGDKDYTPIGVTKEGNVIVKQEGTVTVDTELPAAAALADNTGNPTVPSVGAHLMVMDAGGNWDRLQTDVADSDGLSVAQASKQGIITRSFGYVYNGTSWDRLRGDTDGLDINDISAGTQTNALSVTESAPLTGFATSAKQLADGHNVVISSGTVTTVSTLTGTTTLTPGTAAANLGKAEDAAHTTGDVGVMSLGVENEDGAALSAGDKDYTPIAVTPEGNVIVKSEDAINGSAHPAVDSYTHLAINLGVVTDSVLVASAANKQIWVYAITYTCSVAGTVSFQDEDDLAITGVMDHAANSGLSHPPSGNFAMPIWKLGTDKDLEVDTVTCSIDGWLDYSLVSV